MAGPKPGMERDDRVASRQLRVGGDAGLQRRVRFTDQLVEQLDQRAAQLGGGVGVHLGVQLELRRALRDMLARIAIKSLRRCKIGALGGVPAKPERRP